MPHTEKEYDFIMINSRWLSYKWILSAHFFYAKIPFIFRFWTRFVSNLLQTHICETEDLHQNCNKNNNKKNWNKNIRLNTFFVYVCMEVCDGGDFAYRLREKHFRKSFSIKNCHLWQCAWQMDVNSCRAVRLNQKREPTFLLCFFFFLVRFDLGKCFTVFEARRHRV